MANQDTPGGADGGEQTLSKRVRRSIQASIDQAEQERKRELFRRRLELARQGLAQYEAKKLPDAVKSFLTYLRILEDGKQVAEGALTPGLFDKQKDAHEILLITGVFWDLAKIYDRSKSEKSIKEMRHYLDKFVLFSKGTQFEPLSGETLRKYITTDKPVHKEDFKAAYKKLAGDKCFIATELVDCVEVETTPRLRAFRDRAWERGTYGRLSVRCYYLLAPGIAALLARLPVWVRRGVGRVLDRIARRVDRSN